MSSIQPDHIVGGYRILRRLQSTALGETFEAIDDKRGRILQLWLSQDRGLADPFVGQRFLGEGRALSRLNHPHVRRIKTLGEHEGRAMIVGDADEGVPLDHHLCCHVTTFASVHNLFTQMVSGVRALHAQEVLHRDLRPANVIVRPGGLLRLTGVGLLIEDPVAFLTGVEAQVAGQFNYLAPELLNGKAPTVATDIYGLGVCLYHLLTLATPFASADLGGVREKITSTKPALAPRLKNHIPAELLALLNKLTDKNPAARPVSAEAVGQELANMNASALAPCAHEGRTLANYTELKQVSDALGLESGEFRLVVARAVMHEDVRVEGSNPIVLPIRALSEAAADFRPAPATPAANAKREVAPPKPKSEPWLTPTDFFHVALLTTALTYLGYIYLNQRTPAAHAISRKTATAVEPMMEPPHAPPLESATAVLNGEMDRTPAPSEPEPKKTVSELSTGKSDPDGNGASTSGDPDSSAPKRESSGAEATPTTADPSDPAH